MCGKDHADALIKGIMTVDITIHDKMSAVWQKGVGSGKLRETIEVRYETGCHKFYTRILHELE